MATGLFLDSQSFAHRPPNGHPESPARLAAVQRALEHRDFQDLVRLTGRPASEANLLLAHSPAHLEAVLGPVAEAAERDGYVAIDADTIMSRGSADAALWAAGAVVAAVDDVVQSRLRNAFCAVRPPGHHAERETPMGFCLFNNVAVGALHARAAHGLQRVAVIDFDVHHGNGTQDIFYSDPDAFYGSTHQSPLYPGTGGEAEQGVSANIVNACLRPGAGGAAFRSAYETRVLPALESFRPDIILVSAGFDGHAADPLAQLELVESDFAWVTAAICSLAKGLCKGRVVSVLEGGYDLGALGRSASAHVRALMES